MIKKSYAVIVAHAAAVMVVRANPGTGRDPLAGGAATGYNYHVYCSHLVEHGMEEMTS